MISRDKWKLLPAKVLSAHSFVFILEGRFCIFLIWLGIADGTGKILKRIEKIENNRFLQKLNIRLGILE